MIKETYREVEITYMETENVWRFIANGRERSAESLIKARESIDRALDTTKKEKWQPVEAYYQVGYSSEEFKRVKITSIAEGSRYDNDTYVWISDSGSRSKENLKRLYEVSEENDALIAKIKELTEQRAALDKEIGAARKAMKPIKLPTT